MTTGIPVLDWIFNGILVVLAGMAAFFLRRTMSEVDEMKKDIAKVKQEYVKQDELRELDKKMDGLVETVNDVKVNYISKNDFFNAMARQESIMERMESKMERYRDEQRSK